MQKLLRLLILEKSDQNCLLIVSSLQKEKFDIIYERVDKAEEFNYLLRTKIWDAIISDYSMLNIKEVDTLKLFKQKKMSIPFIVVSSTKGEDIAVACIKAGAADYILKDNLHKLSMVIEYESQEAQIRRVKKKAEEELIKTRIKTERLLNNNPAAIYSCEPYGNCKITFINEKIEKQFGYKANEILEDQNFWLHHIHDEDAPFFIDNILRLHECGSITQEYRFLRKDNTWSLIRDEKKLIKDDNGNSIEIIGFLSEITTNRESEEKIKQNLNKLHQALEETARALSLVIEKSDLSDSGHKERVTKIACAIARQMSLSDEKIDAIRIASILHDIGKMSIPLEVLNRPGKLNEYELNLVKSHCKIGYDILNPIDYPWPIAEIVLQHHERLNGSGYPYGLQEKDISLEAKIISVADVVEAISSNRPYRPAFELGEALNEISTQKGVLYSPDVVDSCMSLFNTKNFKI